MKRILLTILACLPTMAAFASADSVTVVLNTGASTRGELISYADSTVVVSQRGVEYTFNPKSAIAVVDDSGKYLIGKEATQQEYNKVERQTRIERERVAAPTDRYTHIEFGFSPNKLDDMKFRRVSITFRHGSQLGETPMFVDFGGTLLFNNGSKSYVKQVTETRIKTPSFPGTGEWGQGMGTGTGSWGQGAGTGSWGQGAGTGTGFGPGTMETYDTIIDKNMKKSMLIFSAEIPVRFVYHIELGNFTIAPFAGLLGRFNLIDNYSDKEKSDGSQAGQMGAGGGSGMQGYSQMKEDEANRFQLAATAGVEFMAKGSLFGSVAWNNDLLSYNKGDFGDNFFHGPSFALGVKF